MHDTPAIQKPVIKVIRLYCGKSCRWNHSSSGLRHGCYWMNKIHSVLCDALYLTAALNILWLGMMLERERICLNGISTILLHPVLPLISMLSWPAYMPHVIRPSVHRTLQRAAVSISPLYFILHVIVYIQTPLSIPSHQASFSWQCSPRLSLWGPFHHSPCQCVSTCHRHGGLDLRGANR